MAGEKKQYLPDLSEMTTTVMYDFSWLTTTRLVERAWDRRQRKDFDLYDLAELYHENTKLRAHQIYQVGLSGDVFMGMPPIIESATKIFKEYPNKPTVQLPLDSMQVDGSLGETILNRRSSRRFNGKPIPLNTLSKLLYYSNGITARIDSHEWRTGRPLRQFVRAAASGGALYPIELYAGVIHVEGLTPGMYHYNVREHSLAALRTDENFTSAFPRTFPIHPDTIAVDKAAVVLLLSALFERSAAKYGPRSYRYVLQESGHIAQNTYLISTACGLGSVAVAGFYDDDANEWIDADGVDEAVVYAIVIGEVDPNPTILPISPENFRDRVKSLYEQGIATCAASNENLSEFS